VLALFLQAFIPRRFGVFPIWIAAAGYYFFLHGAPQPNFRTVDRAVIGLAQDMLGNYPSAFNGIAKTIVGYGASSLGVKLDVENAGARPLSPSVSTCCTPPLSSPWREAW